MTGSLSRPDLNRGLIIASTIIYLLGPPSLGAKEQTSAIGFIGFRLWGLGFSFDGDFLVVGSEATCAPYIS